jgi:hypothetical protein
MNEKLIQFARELPEWKKKLLEALKQEVVANGLRPTAKKLGSDHASIYKIINGKSVSVEKLSELVLKLVD